MLKYIVRRILVFIPTLFAISLLAFLISTGVPGDPVENMITGGSNGETGNVLNEKTDQAKRELRHEIGLDLPVFYFSVTAMATPDSLFRVYDPNERNNLERLISRYGNWEKISAWYLDVVALRRAIRLSVPDSTAMAQLGSDSVNTIIDRAQQDAFSLPLTSDETIIQTKLARLHAICYSTAALGAHDFFREVNDRQKSADASWKAVLANTTTWKNYVPTIHGYANNQYHRWLFGDGNWLTGNNAKFSKGVIRGDFGISYTPNRKRITEIIGRAWKWSLLFTLLSVFFAYLISIPVGVQAAMNRNGFFDRSSSVTLFMLYSLPSFFLGTLLLITFSNPSVIDLFPSNGVRPDAGYPEGASILEKLRISLPYLVLPLICYTYSSLAFLSRTMRVAMLEITTQDYIRTARAKGLPWRKVVYKHALRNALFPIITVFSNIFPAAIGGSVIIETIFGIPGMGKEIVDAIYAKDYSLIICVFTLSGLLTLVGFLVADILYAFVDPRISYSRK